MAFAKKDTGAVTITAPKFEAIELEIKGTEPYVQHKFTAKARTAMREKQAAGSKAAKKAKDARDFDTDFTGAQYRSREGWNGIPCASFRRAMIDACRLVGLEMTKAKMAVFVMSDGQDPEDGTSLVRIIAGEPERHEGMVRNSTGVSDIRVRPMWKEWGAKLRIRYDADILTPEAVVNLLNRAGIQIGIGEGRPFSKMSAGCGWGTFEVVESKGGES